MKTRAEYFEEIRHKIDEMIDVFPLHKSMLMQYSDVLDALIQLEKGYKRVDLVKGTAHDPN